MRRPFEPEPEDFKVDINDIVLSEEALDVIENGAWVGGFDEAPGVRFKVLGLTSKAARSAMEAKQAKARIDNGGLPLNAEQLSECMRETLGEVVIQDWDGFTKDGNVFPFDRVIASKWIAGRAGEKLAGIILSAAQSVDDNARSFVEVATKN